MFGIAELGTIVATAVISTFIQDALRQKGRVADTNNVTNTKVGSHMNFGGIGSGYDLVGTDIIGADDDALLHALAVSGGADLIAGLGDSEIVGADAMSLIGAAMNPAHPAHAVAKKKLAQQAALRQIAMRNSGAVIKTGLDRRRRYPLGFVPTTLPASTTALVPSAPQNLFRPERLVIPSDIAFDTGVVDIKVGNQSQLVQSVEVPGALFSEVAIDTHVTFDTAEVGNQVSIQVRNKTASPFEFTAGLIGTIAK